MTTSQSYQAKLASMTYQQFAREAGVIGYRVEVAGITNKTVLRQYAAIAAERANRKAAA